MHTKRNFFDLAWKCNILWIFKYKSTYIGGNIYVKQSHTKNRISAIFLRLVFFCFSKIIFMAHRGDDVFLMIECSKKAIYCQQTAEFILFWIMHPNTYSQGCVIQKRNSSLDFFCKGPSINYVRSFLRILDPPSPPCQTRSDLVDPPK